MSAQEAESVPPENEAESNANSLAFHYIKSSQFRVVHMDGALGGLTPRGLFHLAIYNERVAIPKSQTFEIEDEKRLGALVKQEGKTGIVREVEVDLLMTIPAARELAAWLNDQLAEVTRIQRSLTEAASLQ